AIDETMMIKTMTASSVAAETINATESSGIGPFYPMRHALEAGCREKPQRRGAEDAEDAEKTGIGIEKSLRVRILVPGDRRFPAPLRRRNSFYLVSAPSAPLRWV
ncbi:MAG: hypothetical protein ACREVT_02270, partial [Burkholderiales bacterium]